jgi:hypothetical protein
MLANTSSDERIQTSQSCGVGPGPVAKASNHTVANLSDLMKHRSPTLFDQKSAQPSFSFDFNKT